MKIFQIKDIKQFMSVLLKTDAFDQFLFRQGEISSHAVFTINGAKDKEQIGGGEESYCTWEEIKPFVFETVKGKKLPKMIKLVFSLKQSAMEPYPEVKAVFLNMLFREQTLICTTSLTHHTFSMEQRDEQQWNDFIGEFFRNNNIMVETDEI